MLNNMMTNNLNNKPENPFVVRQEGIVINAIHSQAFLFGEFNMSMFRRKDERILCECGCNKLAKPNNKYIHGHQNRGPNFKLKPLDSEAPLCQCNSKCNEKVTWNKTKNNWRKFVNRHQQKGKNHSNYGKPAYNRNKKTFF